MTYSTSAVNLNALKGTYNQNIDKRLRGECHENSCFPLKFYCIKLELDVMYSDEFSTRIIVPRQEINRTTKEGCLNVGLLNKTIVHTNVY